mgnify:CR=1 FL=1
MGLFLATQVVLAPAVSAGVLSPSTPFTPQNPIPIEDPTTRFTFAVTADMHTFTGPGAYNTPSYFRGAVEAIADAGPTAFMVSPGDMAPSATEWTIRRYLGESYLWYPVVGNHDAEDYRPWFQAYDYDPNGNLPPNLVNTGPAGCEKTTFSFDYGNAHFVVLDEFCNRANGTISNLTYNWLYADLEATTKQHIFVFGHEPAYPQPDADNGRERHMDNSLNKDPLKRDLFWALLQEYNVVAYICGHTHTYSAIEIGGFWQLTTGHSQGKGDPNARSTFLLVHVNRERVTFEAYRDDALGGPYASMHKGVLATPQTTVSLAMVPGADVAQTVIAAEQLAALLEEEAGYNVRAFLTGCEDTLVNDLTAGQVDIGWLSPLAYVPAHDRSGVRGPLHAVPEDNESKPSQFLVRQGSGMTTLDELQGKNFAFVDPSSASGYLYPAAYIAQTQGITHTAFFSQTLFAGSPAAVVEAIYAGEFEGTPIHGGAVYDDARVELYDTYPDIFTQIEVLTYTPTIPGTTAGIRPSLPPLISQSMVSGLLTLMHMPEGQAALTQILGTPQLKPIDDAAYALTHDVITTFGAQGPPCTENLSSTYGPTSTATITGTPGFTITLTWPNVYPDDLLLYTPVPAITYPPGGSREVGLSFALRRLSSATAQTTLTLPTPYTLTVQYDDLALSLAEGEVLRFYYWSGDHWQQETATVSTPGRNQLMATLNHNAFQWTLRAQRETFLPAIFQSGRP